jgi:hypothetical protein
MVNNFLGNQTFIKGLQVIIALEINQGSFKYNDFLIKRYLDRFSYSNTEGSDLWNTVDEV